MISVAEVIPSQAFSGRESEIVRGLSARQRAWQSHALLFSGTDDEISSR